jgi:hypothetical protein
MYTWEGLEKAITLTNYTGQHLPREANFLKRRLHHATQTIM